MQNKELHQHKNQENYSSQAIEHDSLGLNSTLYLAYRDVDSLLERHLYNKISDNTIRMLDFGCGVGLSTQIFLKQIQKYKHLTVKATGVDINEENLKIARSKSLDVDFRCIKKGDKLIGFEKFNLIVCNFVLVEMEEKMMLDVLVTLKSKLSSNGILILTNTTGRVYRSENRWYTSNNQFPENIPTNKLKTHDKLKFTEDQPMRVQVFSEKNSQQGFVFHDFFHSGSSYRKSYLAAGLQLLETYKPLGKPEDTIQWESELEVPPYKLHVLGV